VIAQGLHIRISNPLDEHGNNKGFGLGIGNNKARLTLIYGEECQFNQFIEADNFVVEMVLPAINEIQ